MLVPPVVGLGQSERVGSDVADILLRLLVGSLAFGVEGL
jgi:hypothetical protein